jgi:NTE family protein
MNRNGSNLASYLLFERGFCGALIDLGYSDTMGRREEVLEFLGPGN